jgi:hypothetical protein
MTVGYDLVLEKIPDAMIPIPNGMVLDVDGFDKEDQILFIEEGLLLFQPMAPPRRVLVSCKGRSRQTSGTSISIPTECPSRLVGNHLPTNIQQRYRLRTFGAIICLPSARRDPDHSMSRPS